MAEWGLGIEIAIGGALLAVGVLLGLLVSRGGRARSRLRRLERELAEERERSASYRSAVGKHFGQTSDLFRDLTQQYTALYAHLAEGARELCPDPVPALGRGFSPPALEAHDEGPPAPEAQSLEEAPAVGEKAAAEAAEPPLEGAAANGAEPAGSEEPAPPPERAAAGPREDAPPAARDDAPERPDAAPVEIGREPVEPAPDAAAARAAAGVAARRSDA